MKPGDWLLAAMPVLVAGVVYGADWQPVEIPLMSVFGEQVTPDNVMPEYPRPQMVRKDWASLNGLWDYAITPRDAEAPAMYDGEILVPFCVQSSLSGVRKLLQNHEVMASALWYRRSFEVPDEWRGRQVLLHFEAVDCVAEVWVNGKQVGSHRGGYTPFSFNMTPALVEGPAQTVMLRVTDSNGKERGEARGKQGNHADYEPVTGIWQPVWMEPVPERSIERLKLVPDIDRHELRIHPCLAGAPDGLRVEATAMADGEAVARTTGTAEDVLSLALPNARLWSPDDPFLYDLEVRLLEGDRVIDRVESYFGMRKVSLRKVGTANRILLNNEPVFLCGPLDQGIWPEGILTPPGEAAMRYELDFLKRIGCNALRLHLNGKPRRWYAACDQLGLLVLNDFITGLPPEETDDHGAEPRQWRLEQQRMVEHLYNHPSVIMWLVFNEGWGQHDIEAYTLWAGQLDPTRLITAASGYHDVPGLGHIRDVHIYMNNPSIAVPEYEPERAVVLGEWGGFISTAEGHHWLDRRPGPITDDEWIKTVDWPKYTMGPALLAHYADVIEQLRRLKALGLSGAFYTQLTDMKREQNGYLTLDRKVSKMPAGELQSLHRRLIKTDVIAEPIIEASLIQPQTWALTEQLPAGDWTAPDFDDSGWRKGPGPFGHTPAFILPKANTPWTADRLYLRKSFTLDTVPAAACLRTYVYGKFNAQNTCDIYLNGQKVKEVSRWHGMKEELQVLAVPLRPEVLALLREGRNLLAVEVKVKSPNRLYDIGLDAMQAGNQYLSELMPDALNVRRDPANQEQ